MKVSLAWLREICPVPDLRPEEIAAILTARGLTVDAILPFGPDTVFDLDIPANRPDWLGHAGVARELSAATGVPVRPSRTPPPAAGDPVERLVSVEIVAKDLCRRYTATVVRGVRVGPSPPWVTTRLEACGVRAINNVVDVSNLVLLELGQPIHTFDLDRVPERSIRVRRARAGESAVTLDGIERRLDDGMLVIADRSRPIGVAGVMGGASSEIEERTRDVLIEAAWFLPGSIRATARRLGLSTEASQRFERGADPEAPAAAQDLAASLLAAVASGTPAPGRVDLRSDEAVARTLTLRPSRVGALLGFDPGAEAVGSALAALALSPVPAADGAFRVTVPSWRVDLDREADLVEEVGRHLGYHRIPSRRPSAASPIAPSARTSTERARDVAAGLGFHEALCYSMIAPGEDAPFLLVGEARTLTLANPIAEGLTDLRRSLLPGLVRSADGNLRRGAMDVRLFEIGRVFDRRDGASLPSEPTHLGLVWTGAGEPRHFSAAARDVDLADLSGIVEAILSAVAPGARFSRGALARDGLHPGRSIAWSSGDRVVAMGGELHPALRERFDLGTDVHLAEIDLDLLGTLRGPEPVYRAVSRFPAVSRDLSLVLQATVSYASLVEVLSSVQAPAPAAFELIDRYQGPPLEEGQVSMTVRVILQPADKTLTDTETEGYRSRLVQSLEGALPVKLRSH